MPLNCTQLFWVFENNVISRRQSVLPQTFSLAEKSPRNEVRKLVSCIRELKQPWQRQLQEGHTFACLTMKTSSFARFKTCVSYSCTLCSRSRPDAKWPVLQFCGGGESLMRNHLFSSPSHPRSYKFSCRIVSAHFALTNKPNYLEKSRNYCRNETFQFFRWRVFAVVVIFALIQSPQLISDIMVVMPALTKSGTELERILFTKSHKTVPSSKLKTNGSERRKKRMNWHL